MKEKIIEVQSYLKNKLMANEFDVSKIDTYSISLIIDGEYNFCIWTANRKLPETFHQYHDFKNSNFMDLGLTREDCAKLHAILEPILEDNYQNVIIAEKRKQFEELKKELNIT